MVARHGHGHVDIVRAAIERGAGVMDAVGISPKHTPSIGRTHNRVEVTDVLVETEANIEARNHYGCTPLRYSTGQKPRWPHVSLFYNCNLCKNGFEDSWFFFLRRWAGGQSRSCVL